MSRSRSQIGFLTVAVAVVNHVNGGTVEFTLNISFSLDTHNDDLQNYG